MNNENIRVFNADLGIDGTIPELLDWSYRYDSDYSDDALDYIAKQAETLGFDPSVPRLIKLQRHNEKPGRMPYEQLKLDKLIYDKIDCEETQEYGEVTVREEQGMVLIAVSGTDDEGSFTAANAVPLDEFMNGEDNFLENYIGSLLYYGKEYEPEL